MQRRDFIRLLGGAATLTLGGTSGVLAQSVGDDIARQLRRRGYSGIAVTRTLLGRVRVTGRRGTREREIIVNPNSGEILRDLITDRRTGATSSSLFDEDREGDRDTRRSGEQGDDDGDRGGTSGSGGGGNSGSGGGGGNSGSGGGDDGGGDDGGGNDGGDDGGDDSDDD